MVSDSVEMPTTSQYVEARKYCPECGGNMAEIERCNQDGFIFIWYNCTTSNCLGQWLERVSQRHPNKAVSTDSKL
jgi:hypothetical protein